MAGVVIARRGPGFKPLFTMTNRKSYQRTKSTTIHLNSIFVNGRGYFLTFSVKIKRDDFLSISK